MIKSNKDLVFLLILVGWIIIDAMSLGQFGSDFTIAVTNPIMMLLIIILIIFKTYNNRFNNWLNEDF